MSELVRCLGVLAEAPGPDAPRIATLLGLGEVPPGWQYTAIFVEQLYPYASVYLDPSGMMGGDAGDRIAGFWRALGETPPNDADHLSTLLGAYANLMDARAATTDAAAQAAWEHARAAFLWEHLLSWLPTWLAKLQQIGSPFYTAWGDLLGSWLADEAARLRLPEGLPAHLREVAPLAAPGDDGEAFLGALISPARTGFILTPTDLAQIAEKAGVAVRAGERRYVLKAMLAQDAAATLDGLADLAAAPPALGGPIGAHWQQRSLHSAALLRELATSARC